MTNLKIFSVAIGTMVTLVAGSAALQAQPIKPKLPTTPPETVLMVKRQAGTCPKNVEMWTSFRYYEGGGEHTVIPDTIAIAAPVKLVASGSQFVEYSAPLKSSYASCVGKTVSKDQDFSQYSIQFGKGRMTFRMDLSEINRNPSTPTRIVYKAVLASRPFVRWQIAD